MRNMKPRIFVSSTFYDLKYIREDLSNFIRAHDFDSILFEDGDIGYTPGKSLDSSCYETMKSSDMVVLIIGGLYGSPASSEVKDKFKEYISVTRNEFRSAVNEGVPVFVFIDSKVYSEYAVYEANINEIESEKICIKFSATKDINIFRFIKEIKNIGNISITEFSKLADIKDFLSKQWADMFKKYLEILKEDKAGSKVKDTVDEMNLLVQKMNLMLDSVGKKILSADNSEEYNNVVEMQSIIETSKKIVDGICIVGTSWIDTDDERKDIINKLLDILKESVNTDIWEKLITCDNEKVKEVFEYFKEKGVPIAEISVAMSRDIKSIEKILDNQRKRELLLKELIKDDFYEEMIYEDDEENENEE
ncbi:DUF4062 domain-containing protein [Faecalimonas sp.]